MLLQELKNQLLQIVAWSLVGLGGILLTLYAYSPADSSTANRSWGILLFILGLLLQYVARKWPGRNFAAWVLMGFVFLMNILTFPIEIKSVGMVQTNTLMLFPILAFFLVGKWRGLALCSSLFLSLAALLPFYNWDLQIYGRSGVVFLILFATSILLSFLLALINDRHLDRIAEISMTDPVTNLPNRGGFMLRLKAAVQAGMPFQLVFLDLDHFRRINMVLGSRDSDQLLRKVAEILKSDPDVRDLARDYGDEFVWIHEGTPERLEGICDSIQRKFHQHSEELQMTTVLSASFGATVYPRDGKTHTELWAQAEMALKKAKQDGRRCLRFYLSQDGAYEKSQGELMGLLETAIHQKRIQVHFQPKICMDREDVCGMEALVRWTDPVRGFIPPNLFIPVAEQVGLIHALGDLVNEKTICFLGKLRQEGHIGLSVSINVSPAQLLRGDLCAKLIGLCMTHEVPPSSVILEITEGILANADLRTVIHELRESGFHISLDDFGTGYSSLSYLHHFPITELKIDKSFTDGLLESEKQRRIFESIVHLSRELGLHTVVEGVEKWDQVQYIQKKGKIQIQGWFFARALPEENFRTFLKEFHFQDAIEKGKPQG